MNIMHFFGKHFLQQLSDNEIELMNRRKYYIIDEISKIIRCLREDVYNR